MLVLVQVKVVAAAVVMAVGPDLEMVLPETVSQETVEIDLVAAAAKDVRERNKTLVSVTSPEEAKATRKSAGNLPTTR